MADYVFMKVDGIEGESTDGKHDKWIELQSLSWGVAVPVTMGSTGGARSTDKANFQDLQVSKVVDKASPKLSEACWKGTHIKEITIELCRETGDKTKYLEYKMKDVLITSVQIGSGGGLPQESLSLNPGELKINYIPTDPKTGKAQGNVEVGWDLLKNQTA